MGAFEIQKSRNRLIFRELLGDKVSALETLVGTGVQFCTYASWLRGASNFAELLVERVECFRSAWGNGSMEIALRLTEVCIQPMLSRWYYHTEGGNQTSSSQPEKTKAKAFSDIVSVLGATTSKEGLRDVVNLDAQWNYEFEKSKRLPLLWYSHLLLSKAREAIGLKGFVNWTSQVFPVDKYEDIIFLDKGNISELGIDDGNINALAMAMNMGYISMFRYFEYVTAKHTGSK